MSFQVVKDPCILLCNNVLYITYDRYFIYNTKLASSWGSSSPFSSTATVGSGSSAFFSELLRRNKTTGDWRLVFMQANTLEQFLVYSKLSGIV